MFINPLIIIQSLGALLIVYLLSGSIFPFTTDSCIYISTAEYLVNSGRLVFDNIFNQPIFPDVLPTILSPPGYPLLIASLKFLGISSDMAALFWPRLSFLVLPILLFFLLRNLFKKEYLSAVIFCCIFSLAIIRYALMALTDLPYLWLALLSFILFSSILQQLEIFKPVKVLLLGLTVGAAVLMRFQGIAIVLTIAVIMLLLLCSNNLSLKNFIRFSLIMSLAALLMVGPFLLRNYIAFGVLNPYPHVPSTVSFSQNVDLYLKELTSVIFYFKQCFILVFILLGAAGWFVLINVNAIFRKNLKDYTFFILLIYFFVSSIFLIAYKTIYEGPESIGDRYLLQFSWILILVAAYLIVNLKSVYRFMFVGGLILFQVFAINAFLDKEQVNVQASKSIQVHVELLKKIPKETLIISNAADMVYYFSRKNIRMLGNLNPQQVLYLYLYKRPFYVFIYKEGDNKPDYRKYSNDWNSPLGFKLFFSNEKVDVWGPNG